MRDFLCSPQKPLMRFSTFILDHLVDALILFVVSLGVGGVLKVLGVSFDGIILIESTILCGAFLILILEYTRRRSFYRKLEELVDNLDQRYYAATLLDEPLFLEGICSYQALRVLGKAACDDLAAYRAQSQSYREYVELWIHEVKTPIAAAELMCANLTGEDASKLKNELSRIEEYVEQALYYARSTSLAHDYAIREVALAEVVRKTCRRYARLLIENKVQPHIILNDNLMVFTDSKWLIFILGQIVSNAAKYKATTLYFSVKEEKHKTAAGSTVLEIADNGCGIAPCDVPRVFDQGFTGINGRMCGSSTGMGLYLVASMCEQMGLGITLASEQGVGTRVMIAFPHDRRLSSLHT